MKTLITLVRREIWEHRASFITTPVVIGGIMVLVAVCAMLVWGIRFQEHAALPFMLGVNMQAGVSMSLFSAGAPFVVVLWLVVAHYFLSCLYDDRKDRSVLFWYSMPVSQTQVILSKLIAGLVIAPVFVFGLMLLTDMVLLLLGSLELLLVGAGGLALALWHPGAILLTWCMQALALIKQAIWLLPFFTWFMLASAYARRSPFLRAVVPIILILVIEAFFFFDHQWLFNFIANHFGSAVTAWERSAGLTAQWLGGGPVEISSSCDTTCLVWLCGGVILSVIFAVVAGLCRRRYLEKN